MNELIESDPELYQADSEENYIKAKNKSSRDKLKAEIQHQLNKNDVE